MTPWPAVAALGAVAAATLRRMRTQLASDGGIGRGTAAVLDVLYLSHVAAVVAVRDDPPRMHPWATVPGVGLVLSGAAALVASMRRFPSASQVNAMDDRELVTEGIYRYSRNPQYVGWAAVLAGTALVLRSPRALAVASVYPAAVSWWVRLEEGHLDSRFGEPYRRYRAAVPRWIGRATPS